MSTLIKVGAGLCAGAAAGALAFAFWPQIQPAALNAKVAVEKPVFVQLPAPPKTPAPEIDKDALAKLAMAMPAAKPLSNSAVRGLTIPVNAPAGATALAPPPAADPTPAASEDARRLLARRASSRWPTATSPPPGRSSSKRRRRGRRAGAHRARRHLRSDDPRPAWASSASRATSVARAATITARALSAGVDAAKDRIAALKLRNRLKRPAAGYRVIDARSTSRSGSLVQARLTKSSCRTSPASTKATTPGRSDVGQAALRRDAVALAVATAQRVVFLARRRRIGADEERAADATPSTQSPNLSSSP